MDEAQSLEFKLLVGPKALAAFEALDVDERFDLDEAFTHYAGDLHQLAAAFFRTLCEGAREAAAGAVTGKERIKIGPLEIEEAGSSGGVEAARAASWCSEAERFRKLSGFGAGDFAPIIGEWGVR
jgi:hypothetical protein